MPLNYEQAKDQIANEENYVTWSAFESVHFYGTIKWRECNAKATELYADSVARDAWDRACAEVEREAQEYIRPEYQPK